MAARLPVIDLTILVGTPCLMQPGPGTALPGNGRRRNRDPPAWNPDREATYPSRHWSQDLLSWSLLNPDIDSAQQTAAVVLELQGRA